MPLHTKLGWDSIQGVQASDFKPSSAEKMAAGNELAWLESYGPTIWDSIQSRIGGKSYELNDDEAREIVKEENLPGFSLQSGRKYTYYGLRTLMERHQRLLEANAVVAQTDIESESILRAGTQFAYGLVDPLNVASAIVPEAIPAFRALRVAKLAAAASRGAMTRIGA